MRDLSRFAARLVPAREDLAARHLEGRVAARRFVEGRDRAVAVPLLDLTSVPEPAAERATQLLFGERFTVYDEAEGLAWGQAEDGYVGYVAAEGLRPAEGPRAAARGSARRVRALATHLYPEPAVRARPGPSLPFMSRVTVVEERGGWSRVAEGGGWVPSPHLAAPEGDFVGQAARFLGTPYLWGGRSAAGLDCSGLVQLALLGAGVRAPRDSDMQAALVGEPSDAARPERGDLVFWRGHVGIMADGETLIHANAHAMAVTAEPLAAVVARAAKAGSGGGPVVGRRRGAADRADWLEDAGPQAWLPPRSPC